MAEGGVTRWRAQQDPATGSTFFIGGIAAPDFYSRVAGDFDWSIQSFRQMSQDEAEAVEPNLIDLYTAREGDAWQSIAQGKGS